MSEAQEVKKPNGTPPPEPPKALSLISKLCEAGAAIGWIEKGGYNEFHKYKYATEADIVSALRGELFKRKVFIFPHIVKYMRTPIEVETMKWDDQEKRKVPNVRKTAITEMDIEWTFVDGESDERWTVMVPGVGEDSVDKGLYKAFTGSEKYLLMKSFLLPTGDDPEHDSKEEYETARQSGKEAAQAIGKAKAAELQAKMDARAKTEAPAASDVPVLFSVLVYNDVNNEIYEISGDGEVMEAHKELLLFHGKKVVSGKGQDRKAVVHMTAQKLNDFVFLFEERGGKVKPLQRP